MYVVTFYSFKGGVGRSMALVNVAAELAKNGRRVLIVDFDLEAPGLTHFDLCKPNSEQPGVVDFINDYLETGEVQDVQNYLLKSTKFPETKDRLWVMPAGRQNENYQNSFAAINWQDLYENHQGFLLMEDLRSQWQNAIQPDYVFIDSRTGYTDISGICTRQLPDAVCLLFTPNKQNLNGLTQIVADIKAQSKIPGLRTPKLHFVASNIPNIDDEEKLLEKALSSFSEQLAYVEPLSIIHHYSSFALINEAVFTLEHPKSQLAKQYRDLSKKITESNRKDRYAVIDYLIQRTQAFLENSETFAAEAIENSLDELEINFSKDKEILFLLARYRRLQGNIEKSYALLNAAITLGLSTGRAYIERAILNITRLLDTDKELVWDDLQKVLSLRTKITVNDLVLVIRLSFRIGRRDPKLFVGSPAIDALSDHDLVFFIHEIEDSIEGAQLTIALLDDILKRRTISEEERERVFGFLGNAYIAVGRLKEAKEIFKNCIESSSDTRIAHLFNFAVADYWSSSEEYSSVFKRIIPDIEAENKTANIAQCLSFALWATGNKERALAALAEAKEINRATPQVSFSLWRYINTTPKEFEKDLDDLEALYQGEKRSPLFLKTESLF